MTKYTRASFSSGRLHYCAGHFPVVAVRVSKKIEQFAANPAPL